MTLPSSANVPSYPWPANARQYDAEFLRLAQVALLGGSSAEGIAGPNTDLVATPGSGLNINVAAGTAFVRGDDRASQGSYFAYVDVAKSAAAAAAHATLPRIDRLALRVYDADVAGSATQWAVELVTGTPTAGATLANLNGAAAVPNTALLLYDVLVPAAFTGPFVAATHFQNRRWTLPIPGRTLLDGYKTGVAAYTTSGGNALSMTVCGDGVTPVLLEGYGVLNLGTATAGYLDLKDGATQLQRSSAMHGFTNVEYSHAPRVIVPAFSGLKTFNLSPSAAAGTISLVGSASNPHLLRASWAGLA